MNNYCTCFPDSWHFIIDYDISNICQGHDMLYEEGGNRKEADVWFYKALMNYKSEYGALWYLVYLAVRKFGWIPWYLHRMPSVLRNLISHGTEWMKARHHLESQVPSLISLGYSV